MGEVADSKPPKWRYSGGMWKEQPASRSLAVVALAVFVGVINSQAGTIE